MKEIQTADGGIAEIKPNFPDAAKRWEAYWNHDIIDRPVLVAAIRKPGAGMKPESSYRDRVYGDLDEILGNALENAKNIEWLGESIPSFWSSLGTHEIAGFCGYETEWDPGGLDMNWCKHIEAEWEDIFPLQVQKDGFLYLRSKEMYRKSKKILGGRVIPFSMDFHTNLDLLMSIRGDAELCMDTFDNSEQIDRGIEYACGVFRELWEMFQRESGVDEFGYFHDMYSEKPLTSLACDFSALIGSDMFKRWVVPALTYESETVGDRCVYHWDGPGALKHCDDLLTISNIHTFRYVPSPETYHTEFLDIYKKCQATGKGICFSGNTEEIKAAHRELDPALTVYCTGVRDADEFHELEKWFVRNT